jgi:hypothetical protein
VQPASSSAVAPHTPTGAFHVVLMIRITTAAPALAHLRQRTVDSP